MCLCTQAWITRNLTSWPSLSGVHWPMLSHTRCVWDRLCIRGRSPYLSAKGSSSSFLAASAAALPLAAACTARVVCSACMHASADMHLHLAALVPAVRHVQSRTAWLCPVYCTLRRGHRAAPWQLWPLLWGCSWPLAWRLSCQPSRLQALLQRRWLKVRSACHQISDLQASTVTCTGNLVGCIPGAM